MTCFTRDSCPECARLRHAALRELLTPVLAVLLTAATAFPVAAAQDTVLRRPFEHQRHEALSCRGCHGAGASHRTTRVRSATDCAACHHDPARAMPCLKCHGLDAIPAERRIRVAITLQVAAAARERNLTFRHDIHVAPRSGLGCADCHGAEVTLKRNRECGSCHGDHHRATAHCAVCHERPTSSKHTAALHREGCAGSDCHGARLPLLKPPLGKAVCTACHDPGFRHKSGRRCLDCHDIRDPRDPAADNTRIPGEPQ